MTVVATDAEGAVYVPEFAWEVQWTVQVVEQGVWKDKYYGGYNTSMVFRYSRSSETYALSWWQNLWRYPVEEAGTYRRLSHMSGGRGRVYDGAADGGGGVSALDVGLPTTYDLLAHETVDHTWMEIGFVTLNDAEWVDVLTRVTTFNA